MEKSCPKCGYVNNGIDSKCANCYAKLSEESAVPVRRKRRLNITIHKVCLCLIVLTGLAYFFLGGGNWTKKATPIDQQNAPPEPGWENKDNSGLAYIMMCDFLRTKCRSPGLAAFPPIEDPKVKVTKAYGTTYRISSYVESDNSAGEFTRTAFTAEIREVIPGTWKETSLRIDDPSVLMPPP